MQRSSRTLPVQLGKPDVDGLGPFCELAAQLYAEILLNGATFTISSRGNGPLILASATTSRPAPTFVFNQHLRVRISTPGALSRAARLVGVPVCCRPSRSTTHGGTCHRSFPDWVSCSIPQPADPPPADPLAPRKRRRQRPSALPFVDGGVSDNGHAQCARCAGSVECTKRVADPLDNVQRIIVFVNSLSSPPAKWDESEAARHRISC
jgi:hypothetical protein